MAKKKRRQRSAKELILSLHKRLERIRRRTDPNAPVMQFLTEANLALEKALRVR